MSMPTGDRSKFYSSITVVWENFHIQPALRLYKRKKIYCECYDENIRCDANLYRITAAGRVSLH